MKHMEAPGPIIVGVDGSRAAINAAVWAIDEAISRDVPLRIVHVTHITQASIAPKVQFSLEREYAETALRQARAADRGHRKTGEGRDCSPSRRCRRGLGRGVSRRFDDLRRIRRGRPNFPSVVRLYRGVVGRTCALPGCDHSHHSAMRRHPFGAGSPLSSTTSPVMTRYCRQPWMKRACAARRSWCWERGSRTWVRFPTTNFDRRAGDWMNRYPDVDVHPIATRTGMASFLETTDDAISLAVIGSADVDRVPNLIGPRSQPILAHAECSILVVRK